MSRRRPSGHPGGHLGAVQEHDVAPLAEGERGPGEPARGDEDGDVGRVLGVGGAQEPLDVGAAHPAVRGVAIALDDDLVARRRAADDVGAEVVAQAGGADPDEAVAAHEPGDELLKLAAGHEVEVLDLGGSGRARRRGLAPVVDRQGARCQARTTTAITAPSAGPGSGCARASSR